MTKFRWVESNHRTTEVCVCVCVADVTQLCQQGVVQHMERVGDVLFRLFRSVSDPSGWSQRLTELFYHQGAWCAWPRLTSPLVDNTKIAASLIGPSFSLVDEFGAVGFSGSGPAHSGSFRGGGASAQDQSLDPGLGPGIGFTAGPGSGAPNYNNIYVPPGAHAPANTPAELPPPAGRFNKHTFTVKPAAGVFNVLDV